MNIKGEKLIFLKEKALYWPKENLLALSDIHIGKSEVFQKRGIPVPIGSSTQDLNSISDLVREYDIKRLLILGDLVHAKEGLTDELLKFLSSWRADLNCQVDFILGNHDRGIDKICNDIGIETYKDITIGPFTFCHDLDHYKEEEGFTISGHIHPVLVIKGGNDKLRLPCYVLSEKFLILPSFGTFTGGYEMKKEKKFRYFVVSQDSVTEL